MLDAIHVPFVCGGITLSLHFALHERISVVILNSALYHAQLMVYHYQRVFVQTGGVEGQILTSAFYLLSAWNTANYYVEHPFVQFCSHTIAIIGIIVSIKLIYVYLWRFDSVMWIKLASKHFNHIFCNGSVIPQHRPLATH